MKKTFPIILFLAAIISCKKDKEENSTAQTKENIAGSYKPVSVTEKIGAGAESNVPLPTCVKDNVLQLKTDLTYQYTDAGIKCTPPDDESGNWSLPASGKIIIGTEPYDIVSFDGTLLIYSQSEIFSGVTTTYKTTLTKF